MLRFKSLTAAALVGMFAVAPGNMTFAQSIPSHAESPRAIYATPEEVVAAARAASERHDDAAMLDCYSPAGQDAIARFIMWAVAATPTTLPAAQAPNPDRAAFEAKYGLDRRERSPGESNADFAKRLADGLPDKRAFLLEFATRQRAHRLATTRPAPATQPAGPLELQDVTIDASGLTATARLYRKSRDGSTMSQDVKFEKIDGSWRIATMMMY